MRHQLAADERRQNRGEAHHEHQQREHAHRALLIEVVAHDGARHDEGSAAAERLQEAARDERLDALRQRAADRCPDEQREAEIECRLAAQTVRERPIDRLAERDADEVDAEADLHRGRGRAHLARDRRQGGKIGVDGQRPYGRQRAEHESQAEVSAAGRWRWRGGEHSVRVFQLAGFPDGFEAQASGGRHAGSGRSGRRISPPD